MSAQYQVPSTPRVISPSPTPSEQSGKDGYFPPTTRSKTGRVSSVDPIDEELANELGVHEETDPDLLRARSRSRSPHVSRESLRMTANGGVTTTARAGVPSASTGGRLRKKADDKVVTNGRAKGSAKDNDLLSPTSAYPSGFGAAYWRNLSRSPSPLGLIPIHREWRAFVHKHEIPRKALHVSIGFFTMWLYYEGVQQEQIYPVLFGLLVPIFSVDVIRFRWPAFNRFYIRCLGAFMRESEAHDRYNGVIMYLAGICATMYFCRKDVAVVSVLLLSWCDTAASTFGRLWGKYTPRVRKGKSLAGCVAAFVIGVGSAVLFWAVIVPRVPGQYHEGADGFAFHGTLTFPSQVRQYLGWSRPQAQIDGQAAMGVLAVVSGLIASVSEAIDLFGLDDNLTIPILCGAGLGAFLWAFGGS